MSLRQAELVTAVVLLAFVLFAFYQTALIDLTLSSELETISGPRAYPRILLSGMLLLVLLQLVKAWLSRRNREAMADRNPALHPRLTKVAIAVFILALFTALFEPLGYLLTIVPMLLVIGYLNGARNVGQTVVFTALASAVCLLVFRYGLNTVLPEGLLGIDEIF